MNGIHEMNSNDVSQGVAADLDAVRDAASDVLISRLSQDGTCMWVRTTGTEPQWTGDDATDRAMAAPICARCPVQRECLELEFRSFGYSTSSIWGPLDPDERRAVYVAWLERRDGGQR
jgi:WhiB family redox-sensing transcriptional regulator